MGKQTGRNVAPPNWLETTFGEMLGGSAPERLRQVKLGDATVADLRLAAAVCEKAQLSAARKVQALDALIQGNHASVLRALGEERK